MFRDFAAACGRLAALGFQPATIIDVGVAWGTPELYDAFPHARLILVEPIAAFFPTIEGLLATRRGVHLAFGASDAAGALSIDFDPRDDAPASVSLNHVSAGPLRDGHSRQEVVIRRLDEMLSLDSLAGPAILKSDAQGFDRRVIAGARGLFPKIEAIIAEAAVFNVFGSENNRLSDLIRDMEADGYVLYDLVSPLYRPYDQALGQVDAIFVRRDHPLLAYRGW